MWSLRPSQETLASLEVAKQEENGTPTVLTPMGGVPPNSAVPEALAALRVGLVQQVIHSLAHFGSYSCPAQARECESTLAIVDISSSVKLHFKLKERCKAGKILLWPILVLKMVALSLAEPTVNGPKLRDET